MNKDTLRGQWTQLKGEVRKKWGKLTNDDLDVIQGDAQILIGKLVERYGRSREQFEREAATMARLRHPALPRVSDHFVEGGGQFLVMEFIPGDDLFTLLKRRGRPFDCRQVIAWG